MSEGKNENHNIVLACLILILCRYDARQSYLFLSSVAVKNKWIFIKIMIYLLLLYITYIITITISINISIIYI